MSLMPKWAPKAGATGRRRCCRLVQTVVNTSSLRVMRGAALLVVALAVAFSTSFMQRIVDLSDATISADGTRIAFVVSRVDESHNRYDDAVEVKDLRTGSTLLIGAPGQTVSNIAWSPTS